jgi:hypothetical protein
MTNVEEPGARGPYEKDGRAWRIGTQDDVSWIQQSVTPGTAITTAIPPEFEAYGTIALCRGEPGDRVPTDLDSAVFDVLEAHTDPQPWWLGYLETGASDVVFTEARDRPTHVRLRIRTPHRRDSGFELRYLRVRIAIACETSRT